jgi:Leucine-rich repeat (LRR) protein
VINPEQLKHIILSSDYINLKSLNLSNRELEALPEELALLKNLKEIDLSYNKLSEIPKVIFELDSLEVIYIHRNEISQIPEGIERLKRLSVFDISFNQLQYISPAIGDNTELKYLDLAHNQLTKLPDSIVKLINLKKMYLEENAFVFPPADIVDRGLYSVMFFLLHHKAEAISATTVQNIDSKPEDIDGFFRKFVNAFNLFFEQIVGVKPQVDWQVKNNQQLSLSPSEWEKINLFIENIPKGIYYKRNYDKQTIDEFKKIRDNLDLQIAKLQSLKNNEN